MTRHLLELTNLIGIVLYAHYEGEGTWEQTLTRRGYEGPVRMSDGHNGYNKNYVEPQGSQVPHKIVAMTISGLYGDSRIMASALSLRVTRRDILRVQEGELQKYIEQSLKELDMRELETKRKEFDDVPFKAWRKMDPLFC